MDRKKTIITVYHDDPDGRCAAHIIHQYYSDNCVMRLIPYNNIPVDIDSIIGNNDPDTIFIVDCCFDKSTMIKLVSMKLDLIWIDHHKSNIELMKGININGLRRMDQSACYLTWEYLHKGTQNMPFYVRLISDYDNWNHKMDGSTDFLTGIDMQDTSPTNEIWRLLNTDESGEVHNKYRLEGKIANDYLMELSRNYRDRYGFHGTWNGNKCYFLNMLTKGSIIFGDEYGSNDICVGYAFDGLKWRVGVYSKKLDVGKVAVSFGGGGHANAAGFIVSLDKWKMPIKDCEWDMICKEEPA